MKIRTALLATALVSFAPAAVFAQSRPWLADRAYGEGMGIRTGDLELHPAVAGEIGYDSNYFQRSGEAGLPLDNPIYSAAVFRLTPSLTLSTLSAQRRLGDTGDVTPQKLNFRAGLNASYNELVGTGGGYDFSQQRHIDGGANFHLDVLPMRPWGADILGNFMRSVQPSNDPAATSAWNRQTFRLGVGTTWRPGGGLFEWRVGYDFYYNYFEQPVFQTFNNAQHSVNTRGRFKFLPRTAVIYDAQTLFVRYGAANPVRNDGNIIQARLGLNGLITNHFALMALAGWAASYYEPTAAPVRANFDSVVGQAELKWYILPQPKLLPGAATVGLSSISLGVIRDLTNSYLADYYMRNRVYSSFSYFVGGRYLVDVQAGYSQISHPAFQRGGQTITGANENRVDAQIFTEYRMTDSFGVNATLRYDASLSNYYLPIVDAAGANRGQDNLAFRRFTGFLGVRWFM